MLVRSLFLTIAALASASVSAQVQACEPDWPAAPVFDPGDHASLAGLYRVTVVLDSAETRPVYGRLRLHPLPPPAQAEHLPDGSVRIHSRPAWLGGEVQDALVGLAMLTALDGLSDSPLPVDSLAALPRLASAARPVGYDPRGEIALDWKVGLDIGPSAYLEVERAGAEGFGGTFRITDFGPIGRGRFCAYRVP